jgi:hypothetical protein
MNLWNIFKRTPHLIEYNLEQIQGTYRGVSPTDESPVAMGELEIIISDKTIKIRHATGLSINEGEISTSELTRMSREELRAVYKDGSKYIDKSIGLSANGLQFIFLPNAKDDEFGLLIKGNEMADMLGPTILYSPAQVQRGVFEKIATKLNQQYKSDYPKGCFPRLSTGGKLPE